MVVVQGIFDRVLSELMFTRDISLKAIDAVSERIVKRVAGTFPTLTSHDHDDKFNDPSYLDAMSNYDRHKSFSDVHMQLSKYCHSIFYQGICMRNLVKSCNMYEAAMIRVNKQRDQYKLELRYLLNDLKRNRCDIYAPIIEKRTSNGFYYGYSEDEYLNNLIHCQSKSIVKNTCTVNPLGPFIEPNPYSLFLYETGELSFNDVLGQHKAHCRAIYTSVMDSIRSFNVVHLNSAMNTHLNHQKSAYYYSYSPELRERILQTMSTTTGIIDSLSSMSSAGFSYSEGHFMSQYALHSDYCYGISTIGRPTTNTHSVNIEPIILSGYKDYIVTNILGTGKFLATISCVAFCAAGSEVLFGAGVFGRMARIIANACHAVVNRVGFSEPIVRRIDNLPVDILGGIEEGRVDPGRDTEELTESYVPPAVQPDIPRQDRGYMALVRRGADRMRNALRRSGRNASRTTNRPANINSARSSADDYIRAHTISSDTSPIYADNYDLPAYAVYDPFPVNRISYATPPSSTDDGFPLSSIIYNVHDRNRWSVTLPLEELRASPQTRLFVMGADAIRRHNGVVSDAARTLKQ